MIDIGLTHIALPVSDVERSIEFYSTYAGMQVIHRRIDAEAGVAVVWLCDRTRDECDRSDSDKLCAFRSVSFSTSWGWL